MSKGWVFKGKPYEPSIFKIDESYYLELPVSIRWSVAEFDIPIAKYDFDALMISRNRYYFLFAVLSRVFENTEIDKPNPKIEEIIDIFLHGLEEDVNKFLWDKDRIKNSIVSGFLNDLLGFKFLHNNKNFLSGHPTNWFNRIEPLPQEV